MKIFAALTILASIVSGCSADDAEQTTEEIDLCEQAALHREECVGDYVTPPACDASAQAAAREILETPCDEFGGKLDSKADGALCDWFGAGCTPDEPIFTGARCEVDAECGGGSCIENHCFQGVLSQEFSDMLDAYTGTATLTGSATQLLVDNAQVRVLRRDLAAQATQSLHFSAFIIQDDETGHEMVADFIAAAQRGVEVRVLVDATTQFHFSKYEMLQTLAQGGVQVLSFNPATEWFGLRSSIDMSVNDRLHEKILIADGSEAIVGGRNVGDDYLLDGKWRDTDVYVAGKGVAGIQELYLKDWDRVAAWEQATGCESQADWGLACPTELTADDPAFYPELEELGGATTRAVYSDPFYQETPHGYFTSLALIRGARKSITIANSYFVPPNRMRKHLKAAVARGVSVKVLTNSLESTDAWWMYYASINYYKELIGAGIEIHQYMGTETMHAKTMLIDDELAVVGSYNLDPRSAVDNSESILLIHEGEAVGQLRQAMDVDFAYSTLATTKIPFADMVKARSLRLAEPLL